MNGLPCHASLLEVTHTRRPMPCFLHLLSATVLLVVHPQLPQLLTTMRKFSAFKGLVHRGEAAQITCHLKGKVTPPQVMETRT